MNSIFSKYIDKLFFKKWVFGICRGDINDIIRNKTFDPDINWLFKKSFDRFYADPFFLASKDGNISIILEDFTFDDKYAKISLMKFDKNFSQQSHKTLLDTKSHLSYPFVFTENNKTYIFPESSKSCKLSCYEYDPVNESLTFLQHILELPLLDSTILKYENKYWIFGTLGDAINDYKLQVFFSKNLLGPYLPHPCNPVIAGLNGIRSAGNFIVVDGVIYRPTQNCKKLYGESITINRIKELNEFNVVEEPYMTICINKKNKFNCGIKTIHTINVMDNYIVVDGKHWTFSPFNQLKKFGKKYF
jgi:hypothetical protein